jgi:hypothetical protein
MPQTRLPIIKVPEEKTRSVFTRGTVPANKTEPFFTDEGDTDLICGQCGLLLAQGIGARQIQNIVLHCPACGAYNNVV